MSLSILFFKSNGDEHVVTGAVVEWQWKPLATTLHVGGSYSGIALLSPVGEGKRKGSLKKAYSVQTLLAYCVFGDTSKAINEFGRVNHSLTPLCVCVCVRERERERECVCVCV